MLIKLAVQGTHRALDHRSSRNHPLINYLTHEAEADETEGEVDNTDELVRENSFDLNFEDETQGNDVNSQIFLVIKKIR